MNTKLALLLLVALLFTTPTSSLVVRQAAQPAAKSVSHSDAQKADPTPADVLHGKWIPEDPHVQHGRSPLQPEDGKHHHFHFNRIHSPRRRRPLSCLLCKLVLVIGHIACFLYCYFHVFH